MSAADAKGQSERAGVAPFSPQALMPFAGVFAVALAIAEVIVDWGTWIELNVSVLYGLPLVFAAAARRRRLLWMLAFALVCMTFAVYLSQAPSGAASSQQAFLVDRVLCALAVVLTAGILDAWLRSLRVRDLQAAAIQRQCACLEAVNSQLLAHKEEIGRKNEELERRRHEIEEISHRKTQMLASIAHDIRSPMQAISLMAEAIQRAVRKPGQAEEIGRLAKRMQANAISVVEFVSEVIDVASFDNGRTSVQVTEFDLGELIEQQCQRVLPIAESKGLDLITASCEVRLRTDRVKLGRIIGNLVGNAIKCTSTGSVTVSGGWAHDHGVFVKVSDTGRGIRPEDLNRIFTEFAQFGASPASAGSGWGLGLAISRRMVRLLGGEIAVQSQLQEGSAFTVFLPATCRVGSHEKVTPCAPA